MEINIRKPRIMKMWTKTYYKIQFSPVLKFLSINKVGCLHFIQMDIFKLQKFNTLS